MAVSLCDRLAAFLSARPNQWIDGERLASVAGKYAWRSRVSELRQPPFNLTIENRQRRMVSSTGRTWKVSEYRLVTEPMRAYDASETKKPEGGEPSGEHDRVIAGDAW